MWWLAKAHRLTGFQLGYVGSRAQFNSRFDYFIQSKEITHIEWHWYDICTWEVIFEINIWYLMSIIIDQLVKDCNAPPTNWFYIHLLFLNFLILFPSQITSNYIVRAFTRLYLNWEFMVKIIFYKTYYYNRHGNLAKSI